MFSTTGCVMEREYGVRCHYGIHNGYIAQFNKNNKWEYISTVKLFEVFQRWARNNNEKIDWITKPKLITDWTTSGGVVKQMRCPTKDRRVSTMNVDKHPLFKNNTDADAYYNDNDEDVEPPNDDEF